MQFSSFNDVVGSPVLFSREPEDDRGRGNLANTAHLSKVGSGGKGSNGPEVILGKSRSHDRATRIWNRKNCGF
jgi:hypothetical protein